MTGLSCRSNPNGCVFKWSRCNGDFGSALENELHHLSVHKTMHGFSIHMSDEVTLSEACRVGGATIFYMPDHVMQCVDVTLSHINADRSEGEAILFA